MPIRSQEARGLPVLQLPSPLGQHRVGNPERRFERVHAASSVLFGAPPVSGGSVSGLTATRLEDPRNERRPRTNWRSPQPAPRIVKKVPAVRPRQAPIPTRGQSKHAEPQERLQVRPYVALHQGPSRARFSPRQPVKTLSLIRGGCRDWRGRPRPFVGPNLAVLSLDPGNPPVENPSVASFGSGVRVPSFAALPSGQARGPQAC